MTIQNVSALSPYSYYPMTQPSLKPAYVPPPVPIGATHTDVYQDPVATYFNIFSAKPSHPFAYTKDELEILKTDKYHDFLPEYIEKKNYARALDYINQYESERDYSELRKYVNNPAFDSLVNSKFYDKDFGGFEKLAKTIYSIHKTQQDASKKVMTPGYSFPAMPDSNQLYASISVNDCITNLDKFFKSGFSDDLKYFIKNGTDKLSDLWYVAHNLEDIDKTTDVSKLTMTYWIM